MTKEEWAARKARSLDSLERSGLMDIDMVYRSFENALDRLSAKLADYKWLNRDRGMIRSTCERIIKHVQSKSDPDQFEHTVRQVRSFRITHERTAEPRRGEEVVMPVEDEWQFVSICLESRCQLCIKTGGECDQCKIRKMLARYVEENDPGYMDCGYKMTELDRESKKHGFNKQEVYK